MAAHLGAAEGSSRSKPKAAAARANGFLDGRPRKNSPSGKQGIQYSWALPNRDKTQVPISGVSLALLGVCLCVMREPVSLFLCLS
jgi:hypothetical protein